MGKIYSLPNRFLGIDDSNAHEYNKWSLSKRSALRWYAHMKKVDEVARQYRQSVCVINYDNLCVSPAPTLKVLKDFFGLRFNFKTPNIKIDSLRKKDKLNSSDVSDIHNSLLHLNKLAPTLDEQYIPMSEYLS